MIALAATLILALDSYSDKNFEYRFVDLQKPAVPELTSPIRHVMLPKNMLKAIPKDYFDTETGTLKILHEEEWRGLGITQSLGWQHYEIHAPEPHILLFKYVVANPLRSHSFTYNL